MPRKYQHVCSGTFKYTIEEVDFAGDCLQVEVSLAYTIEPYDPGIRYDRDGSGYPPSGGGVDELTATVLSAGGATKEYGKEDFERIWEAVDAKIDKDDKLKGRLEELCVEDAGDRDNDWRADRDDGVPNQERWR